MWKKKKQPPTYDELVETLEAMTLMAVTMQEGFMRYVIGDYPPEQVAAFQAHFKAMAQMKGLRTKDDILQ